MEQKSERPRCRRCGGRPRYLFGSVVNGFMRRDYCAPCWRRLGGKVHSRTYQKARERDGVRS